MPGALRSGARSARRTMRAQPFIARASPIAVPPVVNPERCRSTCRRVIVALSLPGGAKPGQYRTTGSSSPSTPRSTRACTTSPG